jgi:putative transposase
MPFWKMILVFVRGLIVSRAKLSLELLALRQQLVVLRRTVQRPQIQNRDRWFWIVVSRIWKDWQQALIIVKPETVIKWHRQGFRMYWRWKSRSQVGRPKLDKEIRDLIRRISDENPLWGVPRLQSELRLLGYEIAESTVAKYRVRSPQPPSQTWKAFLENHAGEIVSIDFFTVPTITFRILFCFVVLRHDRRQVVHFNVTAHPTAFWTGQQIIQAFPEDTAPKYLLRDQDRVYGADLRAGTGHQRGPSRSSQSVATGIGGEADRIDPARMSRSCDCVEPKPSATDPEVVLQLLSSIKAPPFLGKEFADSS